MLEKGWIKPSVSPYGSPVLFVQKKTGKYWMCTDFYALNTSIKLDIFFHFFLLICWIGWAKLVTLVV